MVTEMRASKPAALPFGVRLAAGAADGAPQAPSDAVVSRRSASLTVLIATVIGTGAGLFALGMVSVGTLNWEALVILGLLAVLAERLNVSLYGDARLSLAFVPIFASLILFGLPGLVIVAPLSSLAAATQKKRPVYKTAFNAGGVGGGGELPR